VVQNLASRQAVWTKKAAQHLGLSRLYVEGKSVFSVLLPKDEDGFLGLHVLGDFFNGVFHIGYVYAPDV
jgi:hypothetical protein